MVRSLSLVGFALIIFVAGSYAQVPGLGTPTAATATTAATTAAGAAAGGGNIWSKLCMTPEQHQACIQKLCKIPLVGFLGGALTPVSAFSGGLLPSCCPGPNDANPADLLKPADSAEGAASRIKKEEADAKARRAAVRYLATVDCRRFVEAEAALIASLRADTNECVRYEAAMGFATGCCCTKKVLEALVITVSGRKTNEPPECSPRVRAAAAYALERCLSRYCETEVIAAPEKPGAPVEGGKEKDKAARAEPRLQPDALLADARLTLYRYKVARQGVHRPLEAPAPISTPAPPLANDPTVAATLAPHLTPVAPSTIAQASMGRENPQPQQPVAPSVLDRTTPPTPAPMPVADLVPPTGKRDLWNVFRSSIRGQ